MLTDFLKKHDINDSDIVVIACSGGPDSMYLLNETISVKNKDSIVVAHFNHNLRGDESDSEERFVIEFAKSKGVACEVGSMDVTKYAQDNKLGIEEAARNVRYSFLESVRVKRSAKAILTAHHLDDSIETTLFNFVRGTKLHGLTGIPERNGFILRPLLHISKNDILEALEQNHIPYRIDSSNSNPKYVRNHIRKNIVPELATINPQYRKNIDAFMTYAGELQSFIDLQVVAFLKERSYFEKKEWNSVPLFLQREIIRFIYAKANGGTVGLSEGNIAEVIKFIGGRGNKTVKEIKKLKLFKDNGKIRLV